MVNKICHVCIGDEYIKKLIKTKGEKAKCSFCKRQIKNVALSKIAKLVDQVIQTFYQLTPKNAEGIEIAWLKDDDSDYEWERRGESIVEIIQEILDVDYPIAEELRLLLQMEHSDFDRDKLGEESPYDYEVKYEKKTLSGELLSTEWIELENKLKNSSRFFGYENFLKKIFENINKLGVENNKTLILEVGLGKEVEFIYRARVINPPSNLEQVLADSVNELGPPPYKLSKSGRMNAIGISAFYGALSERTAVAEVRPAIGAKVLVGKFNFLKPLRLLDIASLRSIKVTGSLFDPNYLKNLEHSNFLAKLSERISKHVMPDDEPFDYLATQVISDFLAWNKQLNIHGIVYSSAYDLEKGRNIVIFSNYSCVDKYQEMKPSNVFVSLGQFDENGFYEDYYILEEYLEDEINRSVFDPHLDIFTQSNPFAKKMEIEPTLRLDKDSLKVYTVRQVELNLECHNVQLYKTKKSSFDKN